MQRLAPPRLPRPGFRFPMRAGQTVDASLVAWFTALACFKSAATWSLFVKHNRRRHSPQGELKAMAPALRRLLARARSMVG